MKITKILKKSEKSVTDNHLIIYPRLNGLAIYTKYVDDTEMTIELSNDEIKALYEEIKTI